MVSHRRNRRPWIAGALAGALIAGPLLAPRLASAQTPPRPFIPTVEDLTPYAPFEVAPGAPGTHPLRLAAPGDQTLDPAGLAKAQAYSDAHGGFALLVWQGGALRYERYAAGYGEDSRFETFSMHKSVLGLVYGAAIREHVIGGLDDPASKYLSEWKDDPRGRIILRQLLTMESGLRPFGRSAPQGVQIAFGDRVSASALESELGWPPGTRFEYNNANPQIAGAILNRALKAAGKGDYAAYVSRVLLKPLGAGDAHLWLEHEGGDPRFFAHFEVRARDWLRIGMLIAHKGRFDGARILPAAWMRAYSAPSALNPNYGLLVWLGSPWTPHRAYGPDNPVKMTHAEPYAVDDLIYFDGFGGERVYVSPSKDLVIVRIGKPDLAFDDSTIPNAVLGATTRPAR